MLIARFSWAAGESTVRFPEHINNGDPTLTVAKVQAFKRAGIARIGGGDKLLIIAKILLISQTFRSWQERSAPPTNTLSRTLVRTFTPYRETFDQLEKQLASEYRSEMNRKRLTVAQIKRIKAESRVSDLARVREGSATPDQIQRQNALFSPEEAQSYRITNLAQVIDGICKKPIAR